MLSHNEHYAVSCVLISGNLIVQLLHMFQPVFAERYQGRNLLLCCQVVIATVFRVLIIFLF